MVADCVNSCDVDIKKELYSNILLTGKSLFIFRWQHAVFRPQLPLADCV